MISSLWINSDLIDYGRRWGFLWLELLSFILAGVTGRLWFIRSKWGILTGVLSVLSFLLCFLVLTLQT